MAELLFSKLCDGEVKGSVSAPQSRYVLWAVMYWPASSALHARACCDCEGCSVGMWFHCLVRSSLQPGHDDGDVVE